MRRPALLITALAAAAALAPAAAAIPDPTPPIDLPHIPGMPKAPAEPAVPKREQATFKVSLYGIQRSTTVSHDPGPDPSAVAPCFSDRGTTTIRMVAKFSTKRPARAVVTRLPFGVATFRWRGADDVPLPVTASFDHSGEVKGEYFECLDGIEWRPSEPPEERNCSETINHRGFDLSFRRGKLEATPQESLIVPLEPSFQGCPWEASGALYGASRSTPLGDLLRAQETEVVLRMRDRDVWEDAGFRRETVRQSTIYVTFKKVDRGG